MSTSVEDIEAKAAARGHAAERVQGEDFGIQWEEPPIYLISGYAVPREQFVLLYDFALHGDERSPGFGGVPAS